MKEIVNRLHENRQIELAKSILESNGYKVTKEQKKLRESYSASIPCGEVLSAQEAIKSYQDEIKYGYDDEYPEYLELVKAVIEILQKNTSSVFYSDLGPVNYEPGEEIIDTGNDYLRKGSVEGEDGVIYNGYLFGNRDGMMNFIHIK